LEFELKIPSPRQQPVEPYSLVDGNEPVAPRQRTVLAGRPNADKIALQQERSESRQLSLLSLLAIVTLAGCGLAAMRFLPPRMFAGVAGLLSLFTLAIVSWINPRSLALHAVLWTVFSLYVTGAAIALFRH
jgi:hypothetical protein